MNDSDVIEAISQEPIQVKLSCGKYTVRPITIRRLSKLALMLKDIQGDPEKFRDIGSSASYEAMTHALVAAGENMPKALALFTGDEDLAKEEDISLLDLSAIVQAAAKVNKASLLIASFRQAMETINGKPEKK